MKTTVLDQSKGLLWFLLFYALIRLSMLLPSVAMQDKPTIVICLAAIAIAWAAYAFLMDESKGLIVSSNLLVLSLFCYLRWGDMSDPMIRYPFLAVLVFASFFGIYDFIKVNKKDHSILLWIFAEMAVLMAIYFGIEGIVKLL